MRRTGNTSEAQVAAATVGNGDALRVALAWLAQPVSLACLTLFILNDHVLKAEFASWWTGKLSDVAGLVFAPALLAVAVAVLAPRARPCAVAAASLATVGLTFTLVKATTVGAATASAAWTAIADPSIVRADATDLLALPALALAWWGFRRAHTHPSTARTVTRARALILVPLASLAVAATSTSYSDDYAVDVVIEGTYVDVGVWSTEYYGETFWWDTLSWYRHPIGTLTTLPGGWHETWQPWGADPNALDTSGANWRTSACVPSSPDVCYRTVPGRVAVDASDDGGITWSREWGLGRHQQARLDFNYAYSKWFGPHSDHACGIGIAETEDGYVVVATMGPDGVAVRDTSGAWIRVGMPGSGEAATTISNSAGDAFHLIPACLSMAIGSTLGALLVLAFGKKTSKTRWYWYLLAAPALVLAFFSLALAWTNSLEERYVNGGLLGSSTTETAPPAVAVVLIVLALGMGLPAFRAFVPRRAAWPRRMLPVSIGVGVATGFAAILFLWLSWPLPLLAVVWAGATFRAVWLVRRTPLPLPEDPARRPAASGLE